MSQHKIVFQKNLGKYHEQWKIQDSLATHEWRLAAHSVNLICYCHLLFIYCFIVH